jgi:hypothetical protein
MAIAHVSSTFLAAIRLMSSETLVDSDGSAALAFWDGAAARGIFTSNVS